MDMYKQAVIHELREMLTVWEGSLANPKTTMENIARLRLKIIYLCQILDKIEKLEGESEREQRCWRIDGRCKT